MHRPNPFSRANSLMLAMAALAAGTYAAMPGVKAASIGQAYEMLGGYKSRGKGKSKTHDGGGTRAHQRAALKKRNVQRHRRACRGTA